MFRISMRDVQQSPYCELAGNSINCNKTDRTFELRVNQYTSFNRAVPPHSPSPLTFFARFDPARYKLKAPMPSDNSGVVVHGFLNKYERVPSGKHPTTFFLDVDQITFISKAAVPPTISTPGILSYTQPQLVFTVSVLSRTSVAVFFISRSLSISIWHLS